MSQLVCMYRTLRQYELTMAPMLFTSRLFITHTIWVYFRFEIQNNELNVSYKSIEKAKWFFDNITIYLDSLLQIQLKVAARISSEVEDVLSEVLIKVRTNLLK